MQIIFPKLISHRNSSSQHNIIYHKFIHDTVIIIELYPLITHYHGIFIKSVFSLEYEIIIQNILPENLFIAFTKPPSLLLCTSHNLHNYTMEMMMKKKIEKFFYVLHALRIFPSISVLSETNKHTERENGCRTIL